MKKRTGAQGYEEQKAAMRRDDLWFLLTHLFIIGTHALDSPLKEAKSFHQACCFM